MTLLAPLLALAPLAPTSEPAEHADAVRAIFAEAALAPRAPALLAELCRVAPHRLAGSPGAAAAVEWGRQAMLDAGLENVRLEPVQVPRWVRGETAELAVASPAERAATPLPVLALGGSPPTPAGGVRGELLRVLGLPELEELGAERVRGRVVLFDRPLDPTEPNAFRAYGAAADQRVAGPALAARLGAAAALVRSLSSRLDDVPHTGSLRWDEDGPRIPAAAVSTLGADRLGALLELGPVEVRLELDCRTLDDAPSFNVVGELRGRELPEEIVLVGGHLDAWDVGHGAHDDGAGCVQSIEALALLRRVGLRPRRTLRAVLFMNEENGLRGALEYRRAHEDELPRHVLALESDRGGFAPRGFQTDAGPEARAVLEGVVALCADWGVERLWTGGGGADVGPLAREGVVTIGLVPEWHRYFDLHHSALDVIEAVHPRELELGAAAMAALVYVVAELPERLPANAR